MTGRSGPSDSGKSPQTAKLAKRQARSQLAADSSDEEANAKRGAANPHGLAATGPEPLLSLVVSLLFASVCVPGKAWWVLVGIAGSNGGSRMVNVDRVADFESFTFGECGFQPLQSFPVDLRCQSQFSNLLEQPR